ncbi:MAG: glycerol-3-phosphate 1-O-acyltransferase PlsY [Nitrospinae bacterium]|nr:glycerol-3-phosphate 1-O-acyltransferase PlsY [Nitrospinota bacterium]
MPLFLTILVLSYLLGAVPFGLLISKRRGIDVRERGSGNIGATNVLRSVGKKEAALTLLADTVKGMVPAIAAQAITGDSMTAALAGAAAVSGHVFPVFLKFKGGKGVATALGVLIYITPKAALGAMLVFGAVVFLSKYVSLGSISAAIAAPILAALFHYGKYAIISAAAIAFLVIARHHQNILKLIEGTENKLGKERK